MNTKQFFGAIAFAALGITTSAQAENYEGVLTVRADRLRSDLAVEAREAARHPVAGEAFFPETPLVPGAPLARADLHSAAAAAAREGNPYGEALGAGVLRLTGGSATPAALLGSQARKSR